jgi:hypothetical protein
VRALEVAIEVVCTGSGGPELARAVAAAWDWCADDPSQESHQSQNRLTLLLEQDADLLATTAAVSSVR